MLSMRVTRILKLALVVTLIGLLTIGLHKQLFSTEVFKAAIAADELKTTEELKITSNAFDEDSLSPETLARLRELLMCNDQTFRPRIEMRQNYWVLYDYVRAQHEDIGCHEAVTFATHGDYTFLENLPQLVKSWMNPVSFSLHTPGTDFDVTIDGIRYARDCTGTDLIKRFVTFHLYFPNKHMPVMLPDIDELIKQPYNCSDKVVYPARSYRKSKGLVFPINLSRNIARESALTHFNLVADIELSPSPHLAEKFLNMIARNEKPVNGVGPRVYVVSPFEVHKNQTIPTTIAKLKEMLEKKLAMPFHKKMCNPCHAVPGGDKWINQADTPVMKIYTTSKRMGKYYTWEPVFIATPKEPLFDERLNWEDHSNKMPPMYIMCLLNYDFMVLNNAFLVHTPGIKTAIRGRPRSQTYKLKKNLTEEYKVIYGSRKGCYL